MKDDKKVIAELDSFFRKAIEQQTNSLKQVDTVLTELPSTEEIDQDISYQLLQLTLQYRMDTEDVIKQLIKLNGNLCHALGINENNSNKKNLDSAALLLGQDNLLRELFLMGSLWRELNKALSLTEKSKQLQLEDKKLHQRIIAKLNKKLGIDEIKTPESNSKKLSAREHAILYNIKNAIGYQEYFKNDIEQLTEAYHQFGGLPKFGLIYDYLAGLKGPISQFHTAMIHGLSQSNVIINNLSNRLGLSPEKTNTKRLLHQINKSITEHVTLQKQLLQTEQNTKQYWHQLEANLENQRKQAPKPSARLDEAISFRRTMNLFNH